MMLHSMLNCIAASQRPRDDFSECGFTPTKSGSKVMMLDTMLLAVLFKCSD